jgi:hypothetical protein
MREITINHNRQYLEAIYFKDGKDKIYFSESVKTYTSISILLGVVFFLSLIKRATITDTHVTVWGNQNNVKIMVPRQSVTEEEFEFLKTEISNRIKNS